MSPPIRVRLSRPPATRILDFDIETRKVGFHSAGRFGPDGCEPITIAASWVGSTSTTVLMQPAMSMREMLEAFRELYDAAGIVTGHYIRKFDLPILNAAMLEHGLPLLEAKLAQDTKCDLVRFGGMSKSQENLAGTLSIPAAKYHMADYKWRRAARLDEAGVDEARKRATFDVKQHKQLRVALLERHALNREKVWAP